MRNSVLSVLGEMVMRSLSGDALTEKEKDTRDQFLDKLEVSPWLLCVKWKNHYSWYFQDHLHDVHAFVRSKVLQIWLNIINANALPLPRRQSVVDLVVGRLQDKSSSVRKYAIQVVTALLRNNPFGEKVDKVTSWLPTCSQLWMIWFQLSVEDLKSNCEAEVRKLEELKRTSEQETPGGDRSLQQLY